MQIVEKGSGPPVVVIPGIQGRWEWMMPGIDALAARCRVITFSLADEPTCGGYFDAEAGFNCYVDQVRDALDQAGVERAAICGVSYGGLIAAAVSARLPERAGALVLVSALPPSWKPDARVRFYLRAPRLFAPLFWIESPLNLYPEIASAAPRWSERIRVSAGHVWRIVTHPSSPLRMARRVHSLERVNLADELETVRAPALIVTGERSLDRVVPVHLTREYEEHLPHARVVTVDRCGHIGIVTRPGELARIIATFVEEHLSAPPERRRHVG